LAFKYLFLLGIFTFLEVTADSIRVKNVFGSTLSNWKNFDFEVSIVHTWPSRFAAFMSGLVVKEDILAATSSSSGSIWPSANSAVWVDSVRKRGIILSTDRSRSISTTAVINWLATLAENWASFFSVKVTPSGVMRLVPVPVDLAKPDGKDSVAFTSVSFTPVSWAALGDVVGVGVLVGISAAVFASEIVDEPGDRVSYSSPSVSSLFWVASTTEVDGEAFVTVGEFSADFINLVDWGSVSGGEVMHTVGEAPATVVAVSAEDGDVDWLEGHDHCFEIFELSENVEGFEVTLVDFVFRNVSGSEGEGFFELHHHLTEIVVDHPFLDCVFFEGGEGFFG